MPSQNRWRRFRRRFDSWQSVSIPDQIQNSLTRSCKLHVFVKRLRERIARLGQCMRPVWRAIARYYTPAAAQLSSYARERSRAKPEIGPETLTLANPYKQKEASDKSDISRKRAKCVCHLHWRQWNIMMSYLTYLLVGWVFLHEIWPGRRAHYVNYENINNSNLDGMSLASFCQSRAE